MRDDAYDGIAGTGLHQYRSSTKALGNTCAYDLEAHLGIYLPDDTCPYLIYMSSFVLRVTQDINFCVNRWQGIEHLESTRATHMQFGNIRQPHVILVLKGRFDVAPYIRLAIVGEDTLDLIERIGIGEVLAQVERVGLVREDQVADQALVAAVTRLPVIGLSLHGKTNLGRPCRRVGNHHGSIVQPVLNTMAGGIVCAVGSQESGTKEVCAGFDYLDILYYLLLQGAAVDDIHLLEANRIHTQQIDRGFGCLLAEYIGFLVTV